MSQQPPQTPYSASAEKSVLGSIIIDAEAYYRVAPLIEADDFYIKRNAWVFDAIADLQRQRQPVDYITVCDELERRDQLEKIGGAAYVSKLINRVPSAINATGYAKIVRREAYRRRLLAAASDIAKIAHKDELNLDQRRVEARKAFDGAEKTKIRPDALAADEAVSILYDRVSEWADNPLGEDEVRGIPSGLVDLDRLLDGIEAGLYLIGGVQHTGKTAFCQQLSMNVAQAGQRVLIFSMEHSAEYMYHRMASALAKIDIREIRHGLNERQLITYHRALAEIEDWPVEIIGKQLTMAQIEAEIRARMHADLSFVVIDNLEQASASVSGSKEYVRLRRAAYWMLGIAQDDDLRLPVFTTMQIGTKKVAQRKSKKPEMDDLYGSDGPVQAATVVLLLHRADRWTFEDKEKTNEIEVSCWKDKVNFTGTGKGRKFVFGAQGQVWDMTRQEVRL